MVYRVAMLLSLLVLSGASFVGCATPAWVALRNPRTFSWAKLYRTNEPQPSDRTLLLLRRYALADDWRLDPGKSLAKLSDIFDREPSAEKLYALAELGYLGGKRAEARGEEQQAFELHTAAVMHAYLFLFDNRFGRDNNPYDPQFRGACEVYNRALESCLRITQQKGLTPGQSRTVHTANQTLEVAMVARGNHWRPEDFERFEFVSDYDIKGLQNHYHTYGLGVPLIAIRKAHEAQQPIEHYYPEGLSFPATAFLRIVPHPDGGRNHHIALLELYDPLSAVDLMIAGRRVPLETDLSTALAYALDQPKLRNLDTSTVGLLHPDETEKSQGLYMLEPYQPGKIPVIMVHGIWSSPITWMEMFNDLRSAPEIRDRFQFWFYLYPSGQPFWYSSAQLRGDLARMRDVVDPQHRELALDQIVLVGHSMGGLVSKLQSVESREDYWKIISNEPFNSVKASPEVKQTLAQTFFFHPNPSIRRVIFIATPHRGSNYVDNAAARLGNKLITLPKMVVAGSQQLHRDNPAFFREGNLIDTYTSIDGLNPKCPILPVILESTPGANLHYHSIIGVVADKSGATPADGGSDGVVSYASAHLEGVDSEITVNSEHSVVHRHPLSVLEVRRILLEHLASIIYSPQQPIDRAPWTTGPPLPNGSTSPSPNDPQNPSMATGPGAIAPGGPPIYHSPPAYPSPPYGAPPYGAAPSGSAQVPATNPPLTR
jgi:hypothetical protein